ncbi:FkbM family methyltransferase [Burkholderia thailandensis]|uniref:FkbM family methyltransferase n=1 Tax=Burkholderia thailandensis TaxID=57975 RepID=UPI000AB04CE6|nr:FkbM family methyltransferase [Burkholderia thailandensis]
MAEFTFAQGSPGESGLRKRLYISPETVTPTLIPVKVDTLDMHTENLRSVDYIKIDIEGGEIGCLEGATRTIDKFRPLISTEYGYPSYSVYGLTKDSLFNFASSKNYVLFDIFLNRIDTRDEWHIVCDSICWDYFLVPRRETRRLYRESRPTGILTQKPNVESPMPARAAGWHRRGAGIAFRRPHGGNPALTSIQPLPHRSHPGCITRNAPQHTMRASSRDAPPDSRPVPHAASIRLGPISIDTAPVPDLPPHFFRTPARHTSVI